MATPEQRQQCTSTEEEKRMSTSEQRQYIAREWQHQRQQQTRLRQMGAERQRAAQNNRMATPEQTAVHSYRRKENVNI